MTAPKPDRSDQTPNLGTNPDNPVLDLGWNEGFLSDARPYRVELWTDAQVTSLTVFMPTAGIENLSNANFADLLEREQLIAYRPAGRRSAYAVPVTDASGNSVWSVNVVIGDDEETFADPLVEIRPYGRPKGSSSLHVPPNTEAAWRDLAIAIAMCLADLQEDEFLIIAYKRTNYYVQFAAQGTFGMRVEATCNAFITPDAVLTDAQYATMATLGWQRATEQLQASGAPQDPDGSPNFFIDVPQPVNRTALGQLAVATLRSVYAIGHPGELVYRAFGEHDVEIRFPTLGLKRLSP